MFSCAIILLHVTTRSSPRRVSERLADPTMHQPRSVWTAYGSSLLPAIPLFRLIAIGQLDRISIPTSCFSSSGGILSSIFFRCCHLSATDKDGIWSFLDGIVSHICFREFGLRASVRAPASNSSTQATGITLRPYIVLKLRIVLIPSTLSLFFVLFITNVFILVSSKSAYVLTSLLGLSLWTTCTIRHMMVAFDVPTELGDADGI